MPLPERHRARVEPRVDHARDAGRRLLALGTGERDGVDVGPVRVEVGEVLPRALAQLRERPDASGMALLASPYRQGRSPVAIARQGPVDVVGEPIAETAVLD